MRKPTVLILGALLAAGLYGRSHAGDPGEALMGFGIFSHDSRILADRSWGAYESGMPLPWKKDPRVPFYLKASPESAQTPPTELAAALKSIQAPGLDFSEDPTLDDTRFAALIKPLLPAPQLRVLHLEGTRLTDRSIALINQLTNLQVLSLSDAMSDTGLAQLRLAHLQEIKLGKARVTNAGMKALASVKTLRRLDIADSGVSLPGLQVLAPLHLNHLRLGEAFTDQAMDTVSRFTNLVQLDISRSRITDKGLASLSTLPALHTLFLPKTISDTGVARVSKLKSLRRLDLSQTLITDAGVGQLALLSALEELSLAGTSIGDASVDALLRLTKLRILDLTGTRVTKSGLERLGALQKLQVLAMPAGAGLQLRDLKNLNGLKKLKTLAVNGRPLSTAVLAYFKATGVSGGETALGLSGGASSLGENTSVDNLPMEQLQERKGVIRLTGLYQIHEMESDLDHVVPAVETASIKMQEDSEANFLGEIEVGVTRSKKTR